MAPPTDLISLVQRNKAIIAAGAVTCAALLWFFSGSSSTGSGSAISARATTGPKGLTFEELPVPHYEKIKDTEVVWAFPSKPKGVAILAHGCGHGAVDFFLKSQHCPECKGLPEEVLITHSMIVKGYGVIAVSSKDREGSRCWQVPGFGGDGEGMDDINAVKNVVAELQKRENLGDVPVYAVGASSGGAFVLFLAMHMKLAGLSSQIMAIPPGPIEDYIKKAKDGEKAWPPTWLLHMPRDKTTDQAVQEMIKVFEKHEVQVAEVRFEPLPLEPSTLHTACWGEVSQEQSKAIHAALKGAGLLDKTNMLTEDPRKADWRGALAKAKVPGLDRLRLKADESPVSEVLNMLYAKHEIVGFLNDDMMNWFEIESKFAGRKKSSSTAAASADAKPASNSTASASSGRRALRMA